jgi:hypothetical protein
MNAFRVDPGLAMEIGRDIEVSRDPFALFSIALNQKTASDLRRLASNRINDLNSMDVSNFIRLAAGPEMLEAICRSNLFPTTYTSIARGVIECNSKRSQEKALKKAEEKFEAAVSSGALVKIPEPGEIIITDGFAEHHRIQLQTITDLDVIAVAKRKLSALEKYLADKAQRHEVRAARIWTEVRIGELLGPPRQGERTDLNPNLSFASDKLTPNERSQFRQMAEHQEIVERYNKGGTSRAAILSAIKASHPGGEEAIDYPIDNHLKPKFDEFTEFAKGGGVSQTNGNDGKEPLDGIARKYLLSMRKDLRSATYEQIVIFFTSIMAGLGLDFKAVLYDMEETT